MLATGHLLWPPDIYCGHWISPDLKTTVAKLDAVDKKIAAAVSLVDVRLKAQDEIASARHNELLSKLETFNAQTPSPVRHHHEFARR
jgi:hypothetical protein